jgi:hypothetical protein
VQLIGTGSGDAIEHRPTGTTELDPEIEGLHGDFFNRVRNAERSRETASTS